MRAWWLEGGDDDGAADGLGVQLDVSCENASDERGGDAESMVRLVDGEAAGQECGQEAGACLAIGPGGALRSIAVMARLA